MQTKNKISLTRKTIYGIMLVVVFITTFAMDNLSSARAQAMTKQIGGHILSNGQFVYGPNIGDFNLKIYLRSNAPHLAKYADSLYERSEYFSINPKIYLALLEVHGNIVSNPDAARIEDPFDFPDMNFISQIEYISEIMSDAYYLHLYSYSSLPVSQRNLSSFVTRSDDVINIASDTNAGTYAIIAALSSIESQQNISQILDNSQPNGFYQTYIKLFGNDDPLDEKNHIYVPGEAGVSSMTKDLSQFNLAGEVSALSAPSDLLQLPYLRGQSWFFGGVHSNGSGGVQSPYTDASALDFGPGGIAWGGDTSNMWVVASASGIPTKISACYFSVLHNDGWETTYYHLENIQSYSGSINQNDKIGVIANTLAEATCSGGSATGPHVHFNLKHNGALVAINGTALSGWYVHAGRWNYDTDPNYMWLERGGIKKYANLNKVLSEAPPLPPAITGNAGVAGATLSYTDGVPKTVTADGNGNYSITVPSNWSGTVAPYKTGYTFTPISRSYGSVQSNQTAQDYTAQACPACADVDVVVGTTQVGAYTLGPSQSTRQSYTLNNGPVKVVSTNTISIVASERVAYSPDGGATWTSYSELMGLPEGQLTTSYTFPWYNNADLNSQLRFGNVGTASTDVTVTVGGVLKGTYTLAPNASQRVSYVGLNDGPVKVESNGQPIIASLRVAYFNGSAWTSFSEMMGLPSGQLTTSYSFPWYNNVDLNSQLRFGNVGVASTDVTVTVGGIPQGTYTLAPNQSKRVSYAGLNNGPVVIQSSGGVPIIASERVAYFNGSVWTDYSEMMGLPTAVLSTSYSFPVYNNLNLNTQLRFGNVGASSTTVTVTIGGVLKGSYVLAPSQSQRVSYAGFNSGPGVIQSSGGVKIIASERVAYFNGSVWTSFAEMMGLPVEQLTTTYLFPWYNNMDLNTQMRFGVP